ncbi:uncharacterized protein AKAME5_002438100 [Lates japonicus]|uniref:Uncharacterized protein n=1 Tax=Lates japonicus TaxID=270547 RepID=A0AAD3NL86_LATJO|nr:uncharacterized protein AKAME5_002438100 [Lates japonicus]
MTGVGLGVTSGVNSAVTTVTEIGVNRKHQKKASEVFQSFMEDVQSLQDCLEEVTRQTAAKMEASEIDVVVGVGWPQTSQILVRQLSKGLSLSPSQPGPALNALFLGMDIFFICKDSISLAKGSETQVSQFIRARAALWSSEMDSWQRIHDSLCQGLLTSEKNEAILETPFYPEREIQKQIEAEMEIPCDEVDEKLKEKQEQSCVIQ